MPENTSSSPAEPSTWQDIAARKQAQRASLIPPEWKLSASVLKASQENALLSTSAWRTAGILTPWELSLTDSHDATSLLGLLTTGALKSEDVVRAYCKRAAIAQQLTNCLTEIMFDPAIERARDLDAHFARTGRPLGPLHGLPISMKDTFWIAGFDSSVGIAGFCFKPATENAALVELLLSLGAVIHVKTNVPQTMMALDSHNNVFGRTLNPQNNALTAGGSSGGEGALIAMRGSVLGVGTDVGGSIRVPAGCNGLFAIKPSAGFVPYSGQEGGSKPGASKLAIESVAGPLATSLRDCELFMRVISNAKPGRFDADAVVPSWKNMEGMTKRNVTIGIVRTDGHVKPLPPIHKLMDEVAEILGRSGQGIEVIEVDLSQILPKVLKVFNGLLSIDGSKTWFDHLAITGEPLSPWLQGRLVQRPQKTVNQIRELQAQKMELQKEFLRVWEERGSYWLTDNNSKMQDGKTLDAFIMPLAPHPILPIDRWNTVNYTASLNLLDLSTGIIPVRACTEEDLQGPDFNGKAVNGWDKINQEHWTKVDLKTYIGSPLSVQVVTPRLTERRLTDIMNVVDVALRAKNKSSSSKL